MDMYIILRHKNFQAQLRQILRVSIYFENRPRDLTPSTKGTHGRLTFYSGTVNLDDILAANLRGQYIEYHENGISHMTSRESGPLVVTGKSHLAVTWNVLTTSVSANEGLRDRLREAVLRLSTAFPSTRLCELEYQPPERERTIWEWMSELLSRSSR